MRNTGAHGNQCLRPEQAEMIAVALGANLPGPFGAPLHTLEAALAEMERRGLSIVAKSRWWRTAPVPLSDQPWYVNGVAALETDLEPPALLEQLHAIEHEMGRTRSVRNAARVLDLDIIAYGRQISRGPLEIPHPRMTERAFVLIPLAEIAPDWTHPATGVTVGRLIAALSPDSLARMEPVRETGGKCD